MVINMGISIFVIVIAATIGYVFRDGYNRLVTHRNRYQRTYAQIDRQLRRRYELIPDLVATVTDYLPDEREIFTSLMSCRKIAVDASRRAALNPGAIAVMQELSVAEGLLAEALSRLLAVTRSCPELLADRTTIRISTELAAIENRVGFLQQRFNQTVTTYNATKADFPSNLIASRFGFAVAELWEKVVPEFRISHF